MKIQTSQFCTNPEDCPQCLTKAKFNIGNNKNCIKHSILPQESNSNSIAYSKQDLLDQIIFGLQDVEKMIIEYKTKYISNSKNSSSSKTTFVNESMCPLQLQEALIIMKRIQALLGSDSQIESRNQTFDSFSKHEASYRTKSQKQLKQPQIQTLSKNKILIQTSEFRQDNEVKNYIKQWVQYFSHFLNKKTQSSSLSNLKLPLINTIEMKSFYKQIQTFYKGYKTKAEEKDKQFNQLINKLAQYIEKDKRKMGNNIQQTKFMQKYVNTITPPRPQKINHDLNSRQKRSKTPNSKKSSQLIDASIILSNEYYIAENSQQMGKLLFAQACSIQSLLTRIDQIQKQQHLASN